MLLQAHLGRAGVRWGLAVGLGLAIGETPPGRAGAADSPRRRKLRPHSAARGRQACRSGVPGRVGAGLELPAETLAERGPPLQGHTYAGWALGHTAWAPGRNMRGELSASSPGGAAKGSRSLRTLCCLDHRSLTQTEDTHGPVGSRVSWFGELRLLHHHLPAPNCS